MHPYRSLPDTSFWKAAVCETPYWDLSPIENGVKLSAADKVGTLGSCFAQHMSRYIARSGLNYFVTEPAPAGLAKAEAEARNFGVYSARYGNIYTSAQANQLFDRAFGKFVPIDTSWQRNGVLVDPFRPQIEPTGYSSAMELEEDRESHFFSVRRLFAEAEWLVFTLGLTEAWRSREDGSVYPLAPGVAGGEFDPGRYEFVNFGYEDVVDQLTQLVGKVSTLNPGVRFILTVSPVPLIATAERRHVLVSTVASKSILRAAADRLEREFENVFYFPSFEIVTSPAVASRYFEPDLRQVTREGVDHVMRVFRSAFFPAEDARAAGMDLGRDDADVICDEEVIEEAAARAGVISRKADAPAA
jgi:hypothetical protein